MVSNMQQHLVALRVYVVAMLLGFNQYTSAHRVDCPLPDVSVLETLMAQSIGGSAPAVRIDGNVTYVCLQSGMLKDTYRGMSFLARYQCTGSEYCPSERAESQFVFSCTSQGTWSTSIEVFPGSEDFSFIPNPVADFTTPLRTNCSICIDSGLLLEYSSPAVSDEATNCVACPASCNMGARRCFGDQDDDCCNFYDPANGQCLIQCPFDRMVTDTFDCAAFVGFSESEYIFAEEDGTGSVMIEGTPGVEVRVMGGPNTNVAGVRFSGTKVDTIITVPARGPVTVTFNITDDRVSGEADETYPLAIIPTDTTVVIQQRFTTIIITDNDDMRDDEKLMVVHTALISVGGIVYIAGICVAVCLGVILFKKASKRIDIALAVVILVTGVISLPLTIALCYVMEIKNSVEKGVLMRRWYHILIVVAVAISILSSILWLSMIVYISTNDFYDSSDEHIQGDNSNQSGDNGARTGLVVGSFASSVLVFLVWIILIVLQIYGVISETNKPQPKQQHSTNRNKSLEEEEKEMESDPSSHPLSERDALDGKPDPAGVDTLPKVSTAGADIPKGTDPPPDDKDAQYDVVEPSHPEQEMDEAKEELENI